jgi:DNA-binding transcriptional MerR regulator
MTRQIKFNMAAGFRKIEVIEVTGTTSNQLQSLERAKMVIPYRCKEFGRVIVLYTRNQILQIKAIKRLRDQISNQKVKSIMQYLNKNGHSDSLYDKHLVVVNDEVFWVKPDWSNICSEMASVLKIASRKQKGVGQYTLLVIPPLIEAVEEIIRTAKKSKIIDIKDFMRRFKAA